MISFNSDGEALIGNNQSMPFDIQQIQQTAGVVKAKLVVFTGRFLLTRIQQI